MGGDALRLLLDTHILLWWLDVPGAAGAAPRLTVAEARALDHSREISEELGLSAISLWEIAKLVELRRVKFEQDVDVVLRVIEHHPLIRIVRLDALVARDSSQLGAPMKGSDPADQLIVATARVHGLTLVTSDERIRKSGLVPVI